MQNSLHITRPEHDMSRVLDASEIDHKGAKIDPMTLATLDIGLFMCLENIGTSRQRACSALCLSYAEYDYISDMLKNY